MPLNDKNRDTDRREIFEKYHETFYKDLHIWRDYELTSAGFGEWYYDCLPADKNAQNSGHRLRGRQVSVILAEPGVSQYGGPRDVAPAGGSGCRTH